MPTTPTTHPTTDPDQPNRRRRWALAALLLLLLLGLMAAGLAQDSPTQAADRGDGTSDDADGPRSGSDDDDEGRDDETDREAAEQPVDFDVELVDGDADNGDPGDSDFDDDGADVNPCADHDPADGSLFVTPAPLLLPSGDMDGTLTVRNCSNGEVDWSAATKPSIALAPAAGTLEPGQTVPVGLTIDDDQWDPGAIEFKVRVTEGAFVHNTYVDVHAFEPFVGSDAVATDQISAGEGQGGCSHQCITRAKITTGYSSPDVGLDMATTVPTKLKVYLSTNPPIADQAGNPTFGTAPKKSSFIFAKGWKTSLTGLAPTTKYFIIVKATDENGQSAYRHGSFRTVTPVPQGGGFAVGGEKPGCGAGCITKATVTPGDGTDPAKVVVRTHTPATFQLMLSTKEPTKQDGHPHLEQKDVWHTSGLDLHQAWDHEVSGLQPSTTYYGIIVATDANGNRGYATGRFTTDGIDVLITMHKVHVVGDGDDSSVNRGELSFVWGVGDDAVGYRGERKLHPGDELTFAEHERSYTVHDATGTLPTVVVTAFERDADGLAEFCSGGWAPFNDPGYHAKCDWKWNPALSPSVRAGDLAKLPDCAAMGVDTDADGCLRIESDHVDDDHADIWAIVSYTYVD